MRESEFLRSLADLLDRVQNDDQSPNQAALTPAVKPEIEDQADTSTMVPPLQQKIELFKKVAGVDNIYDDECGEDEHCNDSCDDDVCDNDHCNDNDDELEIIKKNAGLTMNFVDDDLLNQEQHGANTSIGTWT